LHGSPVRFDLAVHRGAALAALMGLSSSSIVLPPPCLHVSDDGLPAIRDVYVLNCDCLFAACPMLSQSFDLGGECPGKLVEPGIVSLDLGQIIRGGHPSRGADRGDVSCSHLHHQHSLDRIAWGHVADDGQQEMPFVIGLAGIPCLVGPEHLQAMTHEGVGLIRV
jgi:hypothetical protein